MFSLRIYSFLQSFEQSENYSESQQKEINSLKVIFWMR